jgi:hypothetical protein
MNFLNEITMNQMSLHRQTRQQHQVVGMQAFVSNALTSPKATYWSALFISRNDSNPIEGCLGSLEGEKIRRI